MPARGLPAFKVDAFTATAYQGNPAGVVLEADGLTDDQMQRIAREMNLSETAFVLTPTADAAEGTGIRLRYFTPTMEVPLCGHATIAAVHLLVQRGDLEGRTVVETKHGPVAVFVEQRDDATVAFLENDRFALRDPPELRLIAPGLLGLPEDAVLGLAAVDDWLFVELDGLGSIEACKPDLPGIRLQGEKHECLGIAAWTTETQDPKKAVHLRVFAPGAGIDEDPVTGTANAALAAHLLKTRRLADVPGVERRKGAAPGGADLFAYGAEQGDFCGRPGRLHLEAWENNDGPAVRVGGSAVVVLEGEIEQPATDTRE